MEGEAEGETHWVDARDVEGEDNEGAYAPDIVGYQIRHLHGTCDVDWAEGFETKRVDTLQCARQCYRNPGCTYFSFSTLTRECVQFNGKKCNFYRFERFNTYFLDRDHVWHATTTTLATTAMVQTCDFSKKACQEALDAIGAKQGGLAYDSLFADTYRTTGCFYYVDGPEAMHGFYGTIEGNEVMEESQLTKVDALATTHRIARPTKYPKCSFHGLSPGCDALGSITVDVEHADKGCQYEGGVWTNVSDLLFLHWHNINQEEKSVQRMWKKWTEAERKEYFTVIRPGHRDECQRICTLEVPTRGELCCYFNPATGLGCFIKVGAKTSQVGTGYSAICDMTKGKR